MGVRDPDKYPQDGVGIEVGIVGCGTGAEVGLGVGVPLLVVFVGAKVGACVGANDGVPQVSSIEQQGLPIALPSVTVDSENRAESAVDSVISSGSCERGGWCAREWQR